MSGRISMSIAQMDTRISEVRSAEQAFDECFKKTEAIVNGLQSEWEGAASKGFADQFDRLKVSAFQPMKKLYEDLGQQLVDTQRVVQELDTQIAGKFGSQ